MPVLFYRMRNLSIELIYSLNQFENIKLYYKKYVVSMASAKENIFISARGLWNLKNSFGQHLQLTH